MSNGPKIRIAIIGLGSIARKAYLPILANHPKVEPILCTRDTQTLSKLSAQYRITETYSSLGNLITIKPEAAMVHSATSSHIPIVLKLLEAGIPVFVDKPLAYSLRESEKALALALRNKLILYLGFNRRFAPHIKLLTKVSGPIQISWQKNRVNLPDDPRVFIFDDFIHVVDSLRFLGKGAIESLNVFARVKGSLLETIQVQWQQGETLMVGGMNRVSGVTEEKIEYYTKGNKWVVNDLNAGLHYTQESQTVMKFDNWDSTLYKRGFVDMIEDWINVLQIGTFSPESIEDIWDTHRLCETLVDRIK